MMDSKIALLVVAVLGIVGSSCAHSSAGHTQGALSLHSATDSIVPSACADTVDTLCLVTYNAAFEQRTDTIQLNGVSLFYEIKGGGQPVILLHGNGGSHVDLDSLMNGLSRSGYKVYGIDSRGQGANAPLDEYHYRDMAEDVYQFIQQHGLQQPALVGWSDGGNTALQMEVLHPGTCGLIVTCGANIFPDGWGGPQNIRQRIKNDPHPKPLRKMLYYEPTMTWHDMTTIQCPVLVCAGQNDVILESHSRTIADNIPDAELLIVKGANHTSYVKHSRRLTEIVLGFFSRRGYL